MRHPPATLRRVKPRCAAAYSLSRASRWPRTSSTGSSRAEASATSVTGSSTTMSTASSAERAPPGKSLMSKAICSSAGSSSSGTVADGSGTCAQRSLIVCSCAWGSVATRVLRHERRLVVLTGVVLVVLVELVVDGDVALLRAGPADVELAQRLGLLEGDGRLLEELEQGQEASDDDERAVGVGHEAAERDLPAVAQPADDDRSLLAHTDLGRMQVLEPDGGRDLGRHGAGGDLGELLRGDGDDELGKETGELRLETGLSRRDAPGRGH